MEIKVTFHWSQAELKVLRELQEQIQQAILTGRADTLPPVIQAHIGIVARRTEQ